LIPICIGKHFYRDTGIKGKIDFYVNSIGPLLAIKKHNNLQNGCISREMDEIKLISLDITLSLIFIMPFYNLVQIILFH
jgi:hypothetical protein